MGEKSELHLPDLHISGFRGIDNLDIPRLGRVTLLVGKNGAGKTSVLDAVRVYAARGRYAVLSELLERREEFLATTDEDRELLEPYWPALFHGRKNSVDVSITIGPRDAANQLGIETIVLSDEQLGRLGRIASSYVSELRMRALKIHFQEKEYLLRWTTLTNEPEFNLGLRSQEILVNREMRRLSDEGGPPPAIKCVSLGPGLLSNEDMEELWNHVALTPDEDQAVEALRLVIGSGVNRVSMVGYSASARRRRGRRAVVKFEGYDHPISLNSSGDGALRMFGVALALANSRDGFLLIDEAENGLHYSVHADFWRMVFRAAEANNVQVLATTHSFDCVRGFAQAAVECEDVEGVIISLRKDEDGLYIVDYPEQEAAIAAKHGIEVR